MALQESHLQMPSSCESTSSTYKNRGIHSNHSKGYRDTRVTSTSFLSTVNVWVLETTNLSSLCPQVWAPSCCFFQCFPWGCGVMVKYFQRISLWCPHQYYYLSYADEKANALEERSTCFIPWVRIWLGITALLKQNHTCSAPTGSLWASGMLSWICWWNQMRWPNIKDLMYD